MLESLMHNMDTAFEFHNNLGWTEYERGGRGSFLNPGSLYGAAETKDGWVCVAFYLNSDRVWRGFCELVDRRDLLDDLAYEDVANRKAESERFSRMLEEWMRERTAEECLEKLSEAGIPASPHNTVTETAEMDHVQERDVFREVEHERYGSVTLTRPPFRLSETDPDIWRHAPLLGEHTADVLRGMDYEEERIESLAEDDVITYE